VADNKMTQLADPQAAIASYLDDLLHTATDQALQQDTQAQAVTAPQLLPTAGPQARPEWAEKPFECLIFTVAGLQLAVPLVLLGAFIALKTM